jgi:hypothetical protein
VLDGLRRALALHWLKGEAGDIREGKEGGGMRQALKFLDGWKLLIGTLALFAVAVYDAATGGHATGYITPALSALGWMPAQWDVESVSKVAASSLAVWGFIHKLIQAGAQAHAGVPAAALLSPEGAVIKHEVDLDAGKPAALLVDMKAAQVVEAAKG